MSTGSAGAARLFVAFELPAQVQAALVGWAREALGGQAGARLLDGEALHMTLCFLGQISLDAVDAISAAVASAVAREGRGGGDGGGRAGDEPAPFVFEPDEVRWLPPRRPRVCAVSLRDRDGCAGALQAALSARLSEGGWYSPESRAWLPHVTVARLSRGAGGNRGPGGGGVPGVGRAPVPPVLEPFSATAVVLMRSWPGSRYETLTRRGLRTAGGDPPGRAGRIAHTKR